MLIQLTLLPLWEILMDKRKCKYTCEMFLIQHLFSPLFYKVLKERGAFKKKKTFLSSTKYSTKEVEVQCRILRSIKVSVQTHFCLSQICCSTTLPSASLYPNSCKQSLTVKPEITLSFFSPYSLFKSVSLVNVCLSDVCPVCQFLSKVN